MDPALRFRLLRTILFFCALVWGVAVYGVFAHWDNAAGALRILGATEIAYQPLLDYWLRMAAGAFTLIGFSYLMVSVNPRKYAAVIVWLGWLMVMEGLVLLTHGIRIGLAPFPFYGDVTACLGGGSAILLLRKAAS